jgi:ABC-type multidrug transport system ATPase subunit/pSer/pThr/pTyr-binding forkhead associated (FHA) protein
MPERGESLASAASATAYALYAGGRVPIPAGGLTIGRAADSDLVIDSERASRAHARIDADANGPGFTLTDLGSRHGTLLNGELLRDSGRTLSSGDTIEIAGERVRFVSGEVTRLSSRELPVVGTQAVSFAGPNLTIGRDPSNDVVLADPNVSRFHAEVLATDAGVELRDLGSRNGTRLEGELVHRAPIVAGAEIGVGPFRLVFDGSAFLARDDRGSLRLDAQGVAVRVREKQILESATLSLQPGELMAIIGESGAGKSTLLKALAGVTAPTAGRITVNGEPLANRLTDIGYVPQDEIVHGALTVHEALTYAAQLRLPQDASEVEIEAAVQRVLEELALSEHAHTRIGSLSGGQRKRASVAVELLGSPGLLLLDEPTTGMDPGLESRMMNLFRELADRSRGVALVTHATKNLALCDRVVTMGRGGVLTFQGPPAQAREFFGVDDYDGIYTALDETPAREWRARFDGAGGPQVGAAPQEQPPAAMPARRRGRGRASRQARVLTSRYLKLMRRDRRNLLLLLGQAPVLALAGVGLFKTGIFDRPGGRPADAIQLIFLASLVMIWLGAIDGAREIIKERAVFAREYALGTRIGAYLSSKLFVLFGLVAVQTLLYAGLLFAFRPLHSDTSAYLEVFALLIATGFAAVGMGLLISAAVSSEDQAMSFLPLAVIPQLLFAGTIVPVARMAEPAHSLAAIVFARWSLASIGTSLHMNGRIGENAEFARINEFGAHFFNVAFAVGLLIQAAFLAVFLAATVLLLRRRA